MNAVYVYVLWCSGVTHFEYTVDCMSYSYVLLYRENHNMTISLSWKNCGDVQIYYLIGSFHMSIDLSFSVRGRGFYPPLFETRGSSSTFWTLPIFVIIHRDQTQILTVTHSETNMYEEEDEEEEVRSREERGGGGGRGGGGRRWRRRRRRRRRNIKG